MSAEEKSKRAVYRSKSIAATGLAILLIAALFATAYFQIQRIVRESSMERLEENVETVMEEIHFMLDKDSQVLNAAAEIVSMGDLSDQDALTETLRTVDPLTQTMNICLLLPSDEVLLPNGKTIDVSDRPDMSFEEASALGEHITDRVRSLLDNSLVLRHMVPVVQNGKTAAMLYGIMSLEELPENLSIRNIYHGRASIYLIDTRTGDFLLDTYPTHTSLVNIGWNARTMGRW